MREAGRLRLRRRQLAVGNPRVHPWLRWNLYLRLSLLFVLLISSTIGPPILIENSTAVSPLSLYFACDGIVRWFVVCTAACWLGCNLQSRVPLLLPSAFSTWIQ